MKTSDFDYTLPEKQIAQQPVPRGESRLLRIDAGGRCTHHGIRDLVSLLRTGDLLVVNDTKVIPARLFVERFDTGGRMEILLVERLAARLWTAMARPGKRARIGSVFRLDERLQVEVTDKLAGGLVELRFSEPVGPHLERLGHVPLPPYIRRSDGETDRRDYQTVYADRPGAIAAPTAGLHFDQALLEALASAGIDLARITLHVGIGTFRPVKAENSENHKMDSERYEVSSAAAAAIARTREAGGRIVAVGTTVVRTLESVADAGGTVRAGAGSTDLFIRPGYDFRAVDLLLTNFHLPRSTLLMLVCAFAGYGPVMAGYRTALEEGYRFYSYGDCMLVECARPGLARDP